VSLARPNRRAGVSEHSRVAVPVYLFARLCESRARSFSVQLTPEASVHSIRARVPSVVRPGRARSQASATLARHRSRGTPVLRTAEAPVRFRRRRQVAGARGPEWHATSIAACIRVRPAFPSRAAGEEVYPRRMPICCRRAGISRRRPTEPRSFPPASRPRICDRFDPSPLLQRSGGTSRGRSRASRSVSRQASRDSSSTFSRSPTPDRPLFRPPAGESRGPPP